MGLKEELAIIQETIKNIDLNQKEKNNRELKKRVNDLTFLYSDLVLELSSDLGSLSEKQVNYLLCKVNDALKLLNFDKQVFESKVLTFRLKGEQLFSSRYDIARRCEGEVDKELYFVYDFVRYLGTKYSHKIYDLLEEKEPIWLDRNIDEYLIDVYSEFIKKVKDLRAEIRLLSLSDNKKIDIRMNLACENEEYNEFRTRMLAYERLFESSGSYLHVILGNDDEVSLKKDYLQLEYKLLSYCCGPDFFTYLEEQDPNGFNFETFFKKYGYAYRYLGERKGKIYYSDDDEEEHITMFAHDFSIVSEELLDKLASQLSDEEYESVIQKKKSDDKK